MKDVLKIACFGILFLANHAFAATDTIYLEETVISGNQELPKVLYIFPWREMAAESVPLRTLHYEESNATLPEYFYCDEYDGLRFDGSHSSVARTCLLTR